MQAQDPPPPPTLRGFWALFFVQMQGAFSDNFFKFLVIFFASRGVADAVRDGRIFWILAVFTLPFLLFSMASGCVADRFSKGRVVTWTKWMEIAVMALGTAALFTQSFGFMLGVIFLMSMQSTLFSPAKYSSLPELLPEWRLSWGNGIFGLGTFLAIILGGIAAGVASAQLGDADIWKAGVVLIGLAVAGTAVSHLVPRIAAASPGKAIAVNFVSALGRNLRLISADRALVLALAAGFYFWMAGALIEPTLLVYGQDLLNLDDDMNSLLRAFLAVGIGVGSALAGFLSGRKIEYGLVPLGSFGLALFAVLLAVPGLSFVQVSVLLSLLGISGGFFIVPINALIQHLPERKDKGSVQATSGWLGSLGIFVAALVFKLLKGTAGVEANVVLLVLGLVTAAVTVYVMWLVPAALARLVLWILTHTFYRVRVIGRENIPAKGGALLVSNHLSMADALFLIASTDRHVRFMMAREQYHKWWLRPVARMLQVIPSAPESEPRAMLEALKTAAEHIGNGEVVCLFAEGEVSRIGQTLPFRKEMVRIMKGVEAPVIPVHLDNVWGSIFSFQRGRAYWKVPRQIPYPVTVSYGLPMPPDAAPHEVRKEVLALGGAAWEGRRERLPTLGRAFVRTARRARGRLAFADTGGAKMSFMGALTKVLFLAGRLRGVWGGERNVGILLPPSAGGALTNLAGILMGKTVVNLNYTLTEEGIRSCIAQCGIRRVVTSRKVLDKFSFDLGVPTVTLEEIAAAPRAWEKISAAAMAWLCPRSLLLRRVAGGRPPGIDDVATIIFSSGSTGEPKGAMLSHFNVMSNMLQLNQAFDFKTTDRFLGVLPFFHSLGFTATLVGPAVIGVGAAYHAVPTDARTVGKMVTDYHLTLLLATPTFLQIYLRGCEAAQFGGLNLVVVGAEKMPLRLAAAFEEKFGIRPLEAYGCTECSPGVAVNTRDVRGRNLRQTGNRPGTIGQPLPGVTVKIVGPETGEPCGFGEPGLMWVKGPNVMLGYLGKPELTAEVLVDGWYNTGDIAAQDEDGFITITDRLSRFSKIGGEMVPHIKVEDVLHELSGQAGQSFAVTGLPDEKKGERLAVLHTLEEKELGEVLAKLGDAGIPNLWKPRADQFFKVDALPYLGTGKLDLKGIRVVAAERAGIAK